MTKKEIDARWYANNREKALAKRRADRKAFLEWTQSFKDNKPCTDCKEKYPYYVMQWDHLPGTEKLFNLGSIKSVARKDRVLAEMAKCELVCANCHAIRTHRRRSSVEGDTLLS